MTTWPTDREYTEDARAQIFALGVISFKYNSLESELYNKFALYMQQGHAIAAQILSRLSVDKQLTIFRLMVERSSFDDDITSNDLWFADGYARCAENRNLVVHSEVYQPLGILSGDSLAFFKRRKKEPHKHNISVWSTEQLRNVADEIAAFTDFGFFTSQVLMWREPHLRPDILPSSPVPLLGKPPLPDLLAGR